MGRPKKPVDFAALAAAIGMDPEKLVAVAASTDNWGDDRAYAAEAVIARAEDKKGFYSKTCKQCSRPFEADYQFVSMCSNRCRKISLREMGIDWDEHRPYEDRWLPHKPPLIVPPQVLTLGEIPGQLVLF